MKNGRDPTKLTTLAPLRKSPSSPMVGSGVGVRASVVGLIGVVVGVAASSVGVCGLAPFSLPLLSPAVGESKTLLLGDI